MSVLTSLHVQVPYCQRFMGLSSLGIVHSSTFWFIAIKVRGVRALFDLATIEHGSKWRERANTGEAVAAAI